MTQPILYDYWRSSACYRVRIALNLKGVAYEVAPVNLLADEQMADAYKDENPQGLVPALAIGGRVLTQSLAIVEWLDATYAEPKLIPADPDDRAHVMAMALAIACDIHPVNNLRVLKYLARLGIEPASLAECVRSFDTDALDADALAGIGVDLDAVRSQVEATFGAGALDTTAARPGRRARSGGRRGHIPFDPAAKKMLELALRESIRFSSKGIDTGHLLLAAARTDGTTAQRALAWFGHDRRAVEAAVVATWAEGVPE